MKNIFYSTSETPGNLVSCYHSYLKTVNVDQRYIQKIIFKIGRRGPYSLDYAKFPHSKSLLFTSERLRNVRRFITVCTAIVLHIKPVTLPLLSKGPRSTICKRRGASIRLKYQLAFRNFPVANRTAFSWISGKFQVQVYCTLYGKQLNTRRHTMITKNKYN